MDSHQEISQYPPMMSKSGWNGNGGCSSNALAVQLDAQGKVKYDMLARQGHAKDKVRKKFYCTIITFPSSINS